MATTATAKEATLGHDLTIEIILSLLFLTNNQIILFHKKVIFHCGCTKIEISSVIHNPSAKEGRLSYSHRKKCQSSRLQTPSTGEILSKVHSSLLARDPFVSELNEPVNNADTPPRMLLLH